MKICVKCHSDKRLDSFGRWAKSKDGHKHRCKSCCVVDRAEWTKKNPDYFKEHYKRNAERIKACTAALIKTKDRDEVRAYFKAYHKKNAQVAIDRMAQWRKDNPVQYRASSAAHAAKRRSAESVVSVKWANQFLIEEIYDLACRRSLMTGIKWHVDHVVPLLSKLVCGLHVETNLAVITAVENQSKRNSFWPNMPD